MKLNIVCDNFLFHSGRALLLPEGIEHKHYPTDFMERLEVVRSREFVLDNNSIDLHDDINAGSFRLWLGDLRVSRASRPANRVNIPFFIHDFQIAETNITSGTVELRLAPEGIYQLVLRNLSGDVLRDKPLTFHLKLFNITVNTSKDGSILCLGSPFHFFVDIAGFSMTITPEGPQ